MEHNSQANEIIEQLSQQSNASELMETEQKGCKRQLSADSDSDATVPNRRLRINPVPNTNCARSKAKSLNSLNSTTSADSSGS